MITSAGFIFSVTFILVCYSIRKIIYISHKKHLFDEPSENRKIHLKSTPNLGGVAIFATMMLTIALFLPFGSIQRLNYLIAAAIILFVLGLIDDLVGINPTKKILAQLLVALLLTVLAGFRFTSFYGVLGVYEIPYAVSIAVSVLFILLLMNAFNLIDGINCLAGSLGLFTCLVFAWCFWKLDATGFFLVAIAMCGCLAAFLVYNRTPAKIFMGDTGSLFLGFITAVFSIYLMEYTKVTAGTNSLPEFKSVPAIVFGLLIIPIFDTVRIFLLRLIKGKSPFHADRNHIHHRLIDLDLTHLQATGILLLVTVISVVLAFSLQRLGTETLFIIITAFGLTLNTVLWKLFVRKSRTKKQQLEKIRQMKQTYPHPELAAV
jgi:UDP-GlcNAc:undecaprenyl-phosphate/decaprenyl-phosphate GlcNAc-1-phosphate transferase